MKDKMIVAMVLWVGTWSNGYADHLLFPSIVSRSGGVTTLITVINSGANYGYLQYTYLYKPASDNGECLSHNFVRSTHPGDVITFDVSGTFGGGMPLNDDPDHYEGTFNLPGEATTGYRGYLLVNHFDPDTEKPTKEGSYTLQGQATIMDLVSGSAWGYQAINDSKGDDKPNFKSATGVIPVGQAVPFTFMPPDTWTTKFFVTPIGSDMTGTSGQYASKLVIDINNQNSSGTVPTITCTGVVELSEVMSDSTLANVQATGGWGTITLQSGTGNSPAIIYKLDYTFSGTYVQEGQSANNGMMLTR